MGDVAIPAAPPLPAALSLTDDRPTRVRYWVVGLGTLMAVVLYLDRFCLSITLDDIKKDLGLSDEQKDWLLSAFFLTYALGQVPAGWLSDRYGARAMLSLYVLLWSLFTGLVGLADSFIVLLFLRFGIGLAQAGAYPTGASMVGKWVPFTARGLASAMVSTGGRIGGVAAPVLTAFLMAEALRLSQTVDHSLARIDGVAWRSVMLLYGGAGVVVAWLIWRVVRNRPREHPGCNDAELRLIEEGSPPPAGKPGALPIRYILTSRSLWLSSLSQIGTNFGWVFILNSLPSYLLNVHNVALRQRGVMGMLPILVGLFGMLFGGWLTDRLTQLFGVRWGRRAPMALTRFSAMAGFLLCIPLSDSAWGVTFALCLVALSTDLGTASIWAFMQDVGGKHVGSVLGWGNMWGNLGAAISPLVLGYVLKSYNQNWDMVFLACSGAFLLSGLAALGVDATIPVVPPEKASES
ncbi:MAG: MFS transporter [Planctomycetia bacterium]|nr:MFS transporter [Planctomycetia bacterium]